MDVTWKLKQLKIRTPTFFCLSRVYAVHLYRTAQKASAFDFDQLIKVFDH